MHNVVSAFFRNKVVQYALEVLFTTFIIAVYTFRPSIAYNEMDIIPYAKSVYNPSWLQADWYLSLKIPYRYLFSYAVGFFIDQFGVVKTVFVGRLLTYLFFALAYLNSAKLLSLSPWLRIFLLMVYLQFFQYGIGDAGEWMIGGLDTKVFAYCFALLSLAMFVQNKYRWGLLFAGFSLSFHLLVGGYNLVCLVPVILAEQLKTKDYLLKLIKSSYLFVFSGALGLFALFSEFTAKADKNIAAEAWNIYVNIRVPYHVIPHFSTKNAIIIFVFTLINILFLQSKIKYQKSLALYSLGSVFILLVGLFVFYFLDHNLLKYYFFRSSNVILPLITLFLVASYVIERFGKLMKARLMQFKLGLILLIVSLLVAQYKAIGALVDSNNYKAESVLGKTNEDVALMNWIKHNTDKNAVFLVPAYFESFYLNAERAVLATWKNSPQGALDILEWYKRLKLMNKNRDFTDLAEINKGYYRLTEKEIEQICATYPEIDFVVLHINTKVNEPAIYHTENYAIYRKSHFISK